MNRLAVWISLIAFVVAVSGKYANDKCVRTYKKVGCFKDRIIPDRPLPNELVNRRDPVNNNWDGYLINWHDYPGTLHAIACKCAELAKARNHAFFGLQFYGECWSGPRSEMYARDGIAPAEDCVGVDYNTCDNKAETECIGKAFTNYIYKTVNDDTKDIDVPVPGGWADWSPWTPCSAKCAGGTRVRERSCTNPKPEHGGAQCEGEPEDAEACNIEPCEPVCKKELEVGVILDGSSSVTSANWVKTLNFVKTFADEFVVSPTEVHFGVIHFSWSAKLDFKISESRYWTKNALHKRIDEIRYPYGGTRTDRAIELAEDEFYCDSCGLRSHVPEVLIVLTDGKSSASSKNLGQVTQPLKDKGVTIMAIGVGAADMDELKEIATGTDHVFMLSDFDYLKEKVNKMLKIACNSKST